MGGKLEIKCGGRDGTESRKRVYMLLTGSRDSLTPDPFNPQFLKLPNFSKQFLFPLEA